MTSRLLAAALAALLLPATAGATDVIGNLNVDTRWTLAGSPYRLTGDVTVAPQSTLTIEPGVIVEAAVTDALGAGNAATKVELIVRGALLADGSAASPVVFRSATPALDAWYGISFEPGARASSVTYATIADATYALWSRSTAAVALSDLTLSASTGGLLWQTSLGPTLTRVVLDRIGGTGLDLSDSGGLGATATIVDCELRSGGGTGIVLHPGVTATVDRTRSIRNRIGLEAQAGSSLTFTNNLVVGNSQLGLSLDQSGANVFSIINNTIDQNEADPFAASSTGTGIIVTVSSAPSFVIRNNLITSHGTYGLQVTGPTQPSLDHNDVWGNGTNYQGAVAGVGSISTNPLYVQAYGGTGAWNFVANPISVRGPGDNYSNTWTLVHPGAASIRAVVTYLSTEPCCDYLRFYDGAGAQVDAMSGSGARTTAYATGESLRITFTTDGSVLSSGFDISGYEYSPSGYNYRLQSTSPAIDVGNDLGRAARGLRRHREAVRRRRQRHRHHRPRRLRVAPEHRPLRGGRAGPGGPPEHAGGLQLAGLPGSGRHDHHLQLELRRRQPRGSRPRRHPHLQCSRRLHGDPHRRRRPRGDRHRHRHGHGHQQPPAGCGRGAGPVRGSGAGGEPRRRRLHRRRRDRGRLRLGLRRRRPRGERQDRDPHLARRRGLHRHPHRHRRPRRHRRGHRRDRGGRRRRRNLPPRADAGLPQTIALGQPVSLSGAASSDTDGSIASYAWSFGDGQTGTGVGVSHTYAVAGAFVVTLTVTDDDGATDSDTTLVTVEAPANLPPLASAGGPYSASVGQAIGFDGSGSSDPDGAIASYRWELGDGQLATGVAPSHTYAAAGTYLVRLTVTDDGGATDESTVLVTISAPDNDPPLADAGGNRSADVGESLLFDGTGSTDPDGSIVAWAWDFGDGSSGAGAQATHPYAAAGTYLVWLTVTDDDGAIGQDVAVITVGGAGNRAPVADAGGNQQVAVGVTVLLDGSASFDPDGALVSYSWDLGDGASATGAQASHAYTEPGSYLVRLTVTDDDGDTGEDFVLITVGGGGGNNQPPIADAGPDLAGNAGDTLVFNGAGSSDPDGQLIAYQWDFGDGGSATGLSATHVYQAGGSYTVTLTVIDDQAGSATATTTATVNSLPLADAGPARAGQVGAQLAFDGGGSTDPDGTIAAYAWDFGDGSRGEGQSVNHAFEAEGSYTVVLTVTDDAGARGEATVQVLITAADVGGGPGSDTGGAGEASEESGCGCSNAGSGGASFGWLGFGLVALVLRRKRR